MDGQIQIQTPRITNQNVIDIVEEARTGIPMAGNMQNIDAADILEWSLNKAGMKLEQESVFNQFREKINRESLRKLLRSMENQVFDVQGSLYKVIPNVPGSNLGRRMILADETALSANIPAGGGWPETEKAEKLTDPHTCEHCGAQTFDDPCAYCGKYIEAEKEVEYAS
jgi:hypothetical protein